MYVLEDIARIRPAQLAHEVEETMTLEVVWQLLETGRWASRQALKEASGVDDDTLNRIINFLSRWSFVDVRRTPEILVRRRSGAISPIATFALLKSLSQEPTNIHPKLAERVACRVCNGRRLSFIGENEVECDQCKETQWYIIERKSFGIRADSKPRQKREAVLDG